MKIAKVSMEYPLFLRARYTIRNTDAFMIGVKTHIILQHANYLLASTRVRVDEKVIKCAASNSIFLCCLERKWL